MMRTGLRCFGLNALMWVLCVSLTFAAGTAQPTRQQFESFDRDPGWEGLNNRLVDLDRPIVRQRFGWRPSRFAGGQGGEIGGVIWRSATPAWYGLPFDKPLTLDDHLSASGRFSLGQMVVANQWHTSSAVYLGFFNHREQGWRAINYMGFRLFGQRDYEFTTYEGISAGALVEAGIGTSAYASSGALLGEFRGGRLRDMKPEDMVNILPDNSTHTFRFTYDPKGGNGWGSYTFGVDGKSTRTTELGEDFRRMGATFDHFGIFNEQLPGYQMTAFFDDLTINGRTFDFAKDPGWEGSGNNATFNDEVQYGANDFGWRTTAHAGGKAPGEVGGRLWQVNRDQDWIKAYLGADVGRLSLENRLVARGRIAFPRFGTDSAMQLGWFNAAGQTWPTHNFVGVYLDSLSDVGRIMVPMIGTRAFKENDNGSSVPRILFIPDGRVYDFSIQYDPAGAEGPGKLTIILGDQKTALPLSHEQRADGAYLNRFGLFNTQSNNGKFCEVYLDDIEFTVEAKR